MNMENLGKRTDDHAYGEVFDPKTGEWGPVANNDDSVEQSDQDPRFEIPRLREREPEIIQRTPSIGEIFPDGFDNEESEENSEEKPSTEEIVPPRNRFN